MKSIFSVFYCAIVVLGGVMSVSAKNKPLSFYDPQVEKLLSQMTLEEKIGQMIQAEHGGLKDITDVEKYYLGSLLSGGSSDPENGNSLQAWTDLYDNYQKHALKTRLGIPLLYGIDAVHGHNNVFGAVIFPHNIGLGCTRDPKLVEQIARITAIEVRATGIEAAVRGYQSSDLKNPLSILACAKHYAGDGGTVFGSSELTKMLDQGDTRLDEATLRKIHIFPYVAAVQAGVGSIMPSYSSWNGVKCSASKRLLTEILKEELGFEGFLISDYTAIKRINPDYKTAVEISINAGMDMAMEPKEYRRFFTTLKELVEEGKVPMSRIDDAATRILRVKFAMGLMDKNKSVFADRGLHKKFGSAEHREIARQAVRQSLVLLKNERNTLPISKKVAHVHVSGKSADDIGNQCGGWTIDWQGKSGDVTTGGTTILQAVKNTVSKDTKVTFSKDGTGADGADIGVVVIGEVPYAEGKGDVVEPILAQEDIEAVNNMKKAGIPVVVILISGRPLIINDVLERADAFIAAWLPGTEGQGVADVLFGDYRPTGKLSFSWPRSVSQIGAGAAKKDPLFAYGYGLTY
ncbi:MAG: glycoside hydrolase family 3 C-terminal domain-containing protein [Phycisphaerae bacterium]|nr:glycoside hydrolase family 3 C-terminal domain-containing protein [Phycisphaerae bacterium]